METKQTFVFVVTLPYRDKNSSGRCIQRFFRTLTNAHKVIMAEITNSDSVIKTSVLKNENGEEYIWRFTMGKLEVGNIVKKKLED